MDEVFINDERVQQLWEYCKSHFYTEDQVKALIQQAIQELIEGGS